MKSTKQHELNGLLALMRGMASVAPFIALARLFKDLTKEQATILCDDPEFLSSLKAYLNCCENMDKALEPIDRLVFGRPMGIWQFIKKSEA